ncbi:hotdog fold thioesterase [Rhodobacteraceae bacterium 2CG4]|uniref:Hotdog fold thioesterase n=1 Tax=Halovulum marinum TaxID=2662447 RepID=A0A6L5Z2X1_9RHOB|nr:PaaI family thioesterase [Halovulum marinum]MSU90923.1 hotdog fold thioesterase [Halovulum marinum]
MTAVDSDFQVSEIVGRAPYHRLLGLDFVSQDADAGEVRLGLDLCPELMRTNDGDGMHGGAIASLIDVAAYYAVRLAAGRGGATVALSVDYLRPLTGKRAEAAARAVRVGRTQALADIEVFGDGRLVAVGRARFALSEKS